MIHNPERMLEQFLDNIAKDPPGTQIYIAHLKTDWNAWKKLMAIAEREALRSAIVGEPTDGAYNM